LIFGLYVPQECSKRLQHDLSGGTASLYKRSTIHFQYSAARLRAFGRRNVTHSLSAPNLTMTEHGRVLEFCLPLFRALRLVLELGFPYLATRLCSPPYFFLGWYGLRSRMALTPLVTRPNNPHYEWSKSKHKNGVIVVSDCNQKHEPERHKDQCDPAGVA
jgi:hypothetical protein